MNRPKGIVIRPLLILAATALVILALSERTNSAELPEAVKKPDCRGHKPLAKKTYDTYRWWSRADATPASRKEHRRLNAFVREGCPKAIRREQKERYWRFYRQVIAPCKAVGQRWANCAVALCESGYGRGGSSIYGFTVYWAAIPVLPVSGNRTGTRFAPSSFVASKLEQDVVAAAAFRYGPTPGTCAS